MRSLPATVVVGFLVCIQVYPAGYHSYEKLDGRSKSFSKEAPTFEKEGRAWRDSQSILWRRHGHADLATGMSVVLIAAIRRGDVVRSHRKLHRRDGRGGKGQTRVRIVAASHLHRRASGVPPREKVTDPVGGFPKLAVLIAAVTVTLVPWAAVELLAASVVSVTPFVIVNESGLAALGKKLKYPV